MALARAIKLLFSHRAGSGLPVMKGGGEEPDRDLEESFLFTLGINYMKVPRKKGDASDYSPA